MNKEFGYARISSRSQHEDRQLEALKEYGIDERDIVIDKESGKNLDRAGYQTLKNSLLRPGDTLVIKELDRLSRNKTDIKKEIEYFKDNKIRLKIIDIPTTLISVPVGQEWIIDMVNNILIEVLGSIAEEERLKIKKRQREGIDAALKRGVKIGRPTIKLPDNWYEMQRKVINNEMTAVEAAKQMNLTKATYYKFRKLYPLKE